MRLTCPGCGVHGSIEAFSVDADARRFEALLTELPDSLPRLARRYIALFRPHKRGLSWDRACELLDELNRMVKAGHVENYGRQFPASPQLFASALHEMVEHTGRLTLPMKSHGYLIAIIVRGSGPDAAQAEEAQEQARRQASITRHRESESQEERFRRIREEAARADARAALEALKR